MTSPLVITEQSSPAIAVIRLNRPQKRNALSIQLMTELRVAIARASATPGVRVLILRGEGPSFCAGLDLHEASDAANSSASARALADLYDTLCHCPLVTIASAHGAAMGGGVGLLAACDLVIASDDLRIGFPEVHRGLVAALITALLCRQIPDRPLRRLILLGQTITATEALALSIISRIVPGARLIEETLDTAAQVLRGAPGAIARTKLILDELGARPVAEDLRRALHHHLTARQDDEAAEGIRAFLEKREPRWSVTSA